MGQIATLVRLLGEGRNGPHELFQGFAQRVHWMWALVTRLEHLKGAKDDVKPPQRAQNQLEVQDNFIFATYKEILDCDSENRWEQRLGH